MQENSLYNNKVEDIASAQKGDKAAMEKLITDNNGLIWSIVKRFKDRGYEIDDLYQIAVMGFIRAIKKFDTSFDVRLATYAVPYILGEVRRYMQTEGPIKISRSIKELLYKISEVQKDFLRKGKEASIDEIAKEIGVSKEEIVVALESKAPVNSIYETEGNDEDGISILDRVSTGIDEQDAITNKIAISDLINKLEEREKQVILLRYFRGQTQTEVAETLGVNQVQVSRIERKVLEIMRRKLKDSAATA